MVRALLVACACVLGCGSETTPSTSDASPGGDTGAVVDTASADASTPTDAAGQEKLICDALASRSACPGGALRCEADAKCIYGKLMLPAAATAWAACRGAPSCKSDDACAAEAGQAVGGAAATQYFTDCSARSMACAGSFKDDLCSPALFAYPGAGPGAQECVAKPCDQISACFGSLQAIKDIAACK